MLSRCSYATRPRRADAIAGGSEWLQDHTQVRQAPEGFDWSTGVCAGDFRGLPMWYAEDPHDGGVVRRLEVTADTGLQQALFVARSATERTFRGVATRLWEYALPSTYRTTLHAAATWRVYSDETGGPPCEEELRAILHDLQDSECLVADRAGLSLWRIGSLETQGAELLLQHRERLADLSGQLRAACGRWSNGAGKT